MESIYKTAKAGNRITGGEEAAEGQFPFQVIIDIKFIRSTILFFMILLVRLHCSLNSPMELTFVEVP